MMWPSAGKRAAEPRPPSVNRGPTAPHRRVCHPPQGQRNRERWAEANLMQPEPVYSPPWRPATPYLKEGQASSWDKSRPTTKEERSKVLTEMLVSAGKFKTTSPSAAKPAD